METLLAIMGIFLGVSITIMVLMFWSILFKNTFAHDPAKPNKLAWLVEVPKNRSVVIQKGGRPTHILRGSEEPVQSAALFGIWMLYKTLVMKITGYHVYGPFFTGPTVYDLPRYRVKEENGKKKYVVVDENDPGYRSNHVRTEWTTWYFEYAGAEIQKIPFTIKGSVQIRIRVGKEEDALYKTDSWNVLLDQALNSVIRAVVRRDMTLDMVIGDTGAKLRAKTVTSSDSYRVVADLIMKRLAEYKINDETLDFFGIEVDRADIIDFEDELSNKERKLLRQAVFDKETALGIAVKGEAKAEARKKIGAADAAVIQIKGKATAGAQQALAEVHQENPEIAEAIIHADALRAFASKEGGIIDAVAANFLKGDKK